MPSETSQYTDGLMDVISVATPLRGYVMATLSGSATLSGYFVNLSGLQEGAAVSYTITTTPQTFPQLYNGATVNVASAVLPSAIHGFVGRIQGSAIAYSLNGNRDGTYPTGAGYVPDTKSPQMAISDQVTFGRA
jgi:hypothetical protein